MNPCERSSDMKKLLKILIPVVILAVLLTGGVWYFTHFQSSLASQFLRGRGDAALADENFDRAVTYYQWAWDLEPGDPELSIDLASAYRGVENFTKAEYTLVNAISASPDNLDLYLALSETYIAQDKLLDAAEMLDNVTNEAVRSELEQMRPEPPVLEPESGYYTEYISVGLSVPTSVESNGGTAYLAVGGEYPSLEDSAYESPIELGGGETKAIAVCVGSNNLVSTMVYGGYTIGGVIEEVTLSDSVLDGHVRQLLELGADEVMMTDDLWSITELTVPEGVASLADLSYFTGLTKLTIQNFQGEDFSFLANLSKLETVDFSGSLITTQTINLLGQQTNLKWLSLNASGVSNLSGLATCANLEYLDVSNDHVTDLSPLANCPNLRELHMASNAVTSLDVVATLNNLEVLDLSYNAVENLAALRACTQLQELNLSHCSLEDISALGEIPSLTHLNASSNELTSIDGLENCVNLVEVDLSENKLVSIIQFSDIDTLTVININYNDVVKVPSFTTNSQLQKFYADHNFMEDLSGLVNCRYLNYVTLDYNNISSIDALADCPNLVEVNVFGTNIHSNADVQALLNHGIIVNYTPA